MTSPATLRLWRCLAAGGALREAHIQITGHADTASVIAWYRFAGTRDSLRFRATRPAGQTLIFQGVAGAAGFHPDTLPDRPRLGSGPTDSAPPPRLRHYGIAALDNVEDLLTEVTTSPRFDSEVSTLERSLQVMLGARAGPTLVGLLTVTPDVFDQVAEVRIAPEIPERLVEIHREPDASQADVHEAALYARKLQADAMELMRRALLAKS